MRSRRLVATILLTVLTAMMQGCGSEKKDADKAPGAFSGDTNSVGLTEVILFQKINMHGFSIKIPGNYYVEKTGSKYAGSHGDRSVEFAGDSTSSVLVYRKSIDPSPETKFTVHSFINILIEIDRGAYQMGISVSSYKKIRFDGKSAILLVGRWEAETGVIDSPGINESVGGIDHPGGNDSMGAVSLPATTGHLRAIGVRCGKYLYIIQSVIRSDEGGWDPLPGHIVETFHYLDD